MDGPTLGHILGTDVENLLAALAERCSGVVVCRASPAQKASIVRLMKNFSHQAIIVCPAATYLVLPKRIPMDRGFN